MCFASESALESSSDGGVSPLCARARVLSRYSVLSSVARVSVASLLH